MKGKKNGFFIKWLLMTFSIFFLIVSILYSIGFFEPSFDKKDIELVNVEFEQDQLFRYITGTIKNNSKSKCSYVSVDINLYDENGVQIGNTFANSLNLVSGGLWKFKAPITAENAKTCKIVSITAY